MPLRCAKKRSEKKQHQQCYPGNCYFEKYLLTCFVGYSHVMENANIGYSYMLFLTWISDRCWPSNSFIKVPYVCGTHLRRLLEPMSEVLSILEYSNASPRFTTK